MSDAPNHAYNWREPGICPRCRRPSEALRCAHDGAYIVTRKSLDAAGRDAFLGERIADRYGVIRRIGVGGMGAVYEAYDERTKQSVAIKFLREQYANHPSIRMRFIREAEAGASIDCPYVVALTDFGVESDQMLWLVMEYVQGWTLRDEVNHHGAFTVDEMVEVCKHVLRGLVSAHDAGLIHRDLKHDNIMFCGTREDFICRILDFGVVKSVVADQDPTGKDREMTAAGVLVGSPSYMSPEQIRGLAVGPPADIYALAVVAYEALTARRLFTVNNYEGLLRAGAKREAPPLTVSGRGEPIPAAFDRIIQKALAHDPTARYPDARTMLLALEQMALATRRRAPTGLLADIPTGVSYITPIPPDQQIPAVEVTPSLILDEAASDTLSLSEPLAPHLRTEAKAPTPAPIRPSAHPPHVLPAPPSWLPYAVFSGIAAVTWAITTLLLSA